MQQQFAVIASSKTGCGIHIKSERQSQRGHAAVWAEFFEKSLITLLSMVIVLEEKVAGVTCRGHGFGRSVLGTGVGRESLPLVSVPWCLFYIV